ncbi:MAG TPA: hypothetical protein VFA04_21975 [Bryobacteraceae bacterium]|nr:hypothetical protein [Bryobacteraceae bacterium]
MSTPAQIVANQKNAQASTGPRTAEGKAASSQNAMKHGGTASRVLLAFENPAEFDRVADEFVARLKPVTDLEHFLVDDMVVAHWRMTRMQKIIRSHTDRAAYEHPSKNPMAAMADVMLSPEVAKLQRYENTFRRAYESAWAKLKELQKQHAAEQNEPKSAQPLRPIAQNEPKVRADGADHPWRNSPRQEDADVCVADKPPCLVAGAVEALATRPALR